MPDEIIDPTIKKLSFLDAYNQVLKGISKNMRRISWKTTKLEPFGWVRVMEDGSMWWTGENYKDQYIPTLDDTNGMDWEVKP